VSANGQKLGHLPLDRAGLLIFEADLPDAGEYEIEVRASPTWTAPPDDPVFTVSLSRLRLVPRE